MPGYAPLRDLFAVSVRHEAGGMSSPGSFPEGVLAGHRQSELGASRVLFPWKVWTGFAFHRLHTPGMRPLHPERSTEKILHVSPIPLFRWPARVCELRNYGESQDGASVHSVSGSTS